MEKSVEDLWEEMLEQQIQEFRTFNRYFTRNRAIRNAFAWF